jgi:hypothetical protein
MRGVMGSRRVLCAFMVRTPRVIHAWRSHVGRHRMPAHAHLSQMTRVTRRHGMAQFADDQTAHQQKYQRQALPEKITHGGRVSSESAPRNRTPQGD